MATYVAETMVSGEWEKLREAAHQGVNACGKLGLFHDSMEAVRS